METVSTLLVCLRGTCTSLKIECMSVHMGQGCLVTDTLRSLCFEIVTKKKEGWVLKVGVTIISSQWS